MRRLTDHHELGRSAEPTETSSDSSFGLVFAGCFAALAVHNWWRAGRAWPVYLGIAVVCLCAALLWPRALHLPNRLWMKVGEVMGAIITPLVMTLLFFAVVTPIGFLMRVAGKDTLRLRKIAEADSCWIVREPPGPPGDSMRDQF